MCRLHKLNFRQAKKAGFELVPRRYFLNKRDVIRVKDYSMEGSTLNDGFDTLHQWVRGRGSYGYLKSYVL